jgi:tetratricopeptide (TPR) repeat protein
VPVRKNKIFLRLVCFNTQKNSGLLKLSLQNRILPVSVLVLFLFASCSTKKNTLLSRTYHGVTAKYNGYFNAKIKVKEGADRLANQHEDKYDRILKIYKHADPQKARSIFPDMDEAIKKTSVVIKRHSMVVGGKERNKWIDDTWLLMGKAQFYKHDFFTALETFQFVASEYRNNDIKYDALLWAMKTNLELGRYYDAETIFDYLKNDEKFPEKLKGDLNAAAASMFLQKDNKALASEHLKKAITQTKKRQTRIRYIFILAQLYQGEGNYAEAYRLYERVVKMNPVYEMAFNAKINRARSFDTEEEDSKVIKAQLLKMLRDDKNIDYLDQIYYALAGLEQREGNLPATIDYLNKSVAESTVNSNQKALSYLELAKIYFDQPEYRLASGYYDSTVTLLSREHPQYTSIRNTRDHLKKVVTYLNTIELQDSLQMLAALTPGERDKIISDIIDREREEYEQKQREAELEQQIQRELLLTSGNQTRPGQGIPGAGASSAWYFYNTQAISFGYTEFIKKYGNRKLEDHWRRNNKESIAFGDDETDIDNITEAGGNQPVKGFINNKAKYLKSIPLTAEMKDKSNQQIIDAFYNLGLIYKEQLDKPKDAAYYLEELIRRFPDNKHKLPTFYQLYRLFVVLNDNEKANYYKNILQTQYPESEYTNLINNPDQGREKSEKYKQLQAFYEQTLDEYKGRNYAEVIERKAQADKLFPYNELSAKFDYLRALAIGKTQDINNFERALQEIVINYPSDPVRNQAQDMLAYLQSLKNPEANANLTSQQTSIYNYQPAVEHMVVVSFPNQSNVSVNNLKTKISDYNATFYSLKNLNISSTFLADSIQIITIKGFSDAKSSIDYFDNFYGNSQVFDENVLMQVEAFVISSSNLPVLYNDKDLNGYLSFFRNNYNR